LFNPLHGFAAPVFAAVFAAAFVSANTGPVLTLRILFDDGTKPASLRQVSFCEYPDSERSCADAELTDDPAVAIARHICSSARWVKIYACAPFPGMAAPKDARSERLLWSRTAKYDIFLPLDMSKITTDTERTLLIPRGNASLRVRLLPPSGDEGTTITAQLETLWQSGEPSMIMPGVRQADGSMLFAPAWPGIYYVYCMYGRRSYYRLIALQDGEKLDEGKWEWPEGRISGQLLDAKGQPVADQRLYFY